MKEFPDLLRRIGIGAIGGAAFGILHLWISPFNLSTFIAAIGAGACFAIVVGTIASFLHNRMILFVVSILAGSISGFVWGLIVRPASNPLLLAAIGAAFAMILVITHRPFKDKVSESAG